MNDHLTHQWPGDEEDSSPGRVRGGRVRLAWLSWETSVVLALAGLVAVIVSARMDSAEDARRAGAASGGHDDILEAMTLSPSRDVLVSTGLDQTVRFWGLRAGESGPREEMLRLPEGSRPYGLAQSRDGRFLAVGGSGRLSIWEDREEGWELVVSREEAGSRSLAFAPDSTLLAAGGEGGVVRVFSVPEMEERAVLRGLGTMVHGVAFSPDGARLAASSFGGEFVIWDWRSGVEEAISRRFGDVHCFAFSPDGSRLATAPWIGGSGGVRLWDLATGEKVLQVDAGGCNALAFSADGRTLAGAGVDQSIRVWDARTGELRDRLSDGVGWVKAVLFAPDGRLAYGGRDGAVRFWRPETVARAVPVGRPD